MKIVWWVYTNTLWAHTCTHTHTRSALMPYLGYSNQSDCSIISWRQSYRVGTLWAEQTKLQQFTQTERNSTSFDKLIPAFDSKCEFMEMTWKSEHSICLVAAVTRACQMKSMCLCAWGLHVYVVWCGVVWSVNVCACVYVCVCACVCVCVCVCVCLCADSMLRCVQSCMYTCTCLCLCACMHVCSV